MNKSRLVQADYEDEPEKWSNYLENQYGNQFDNSGKALEKKEIDRRAKRKKRFDEMSELIQNVLESVKNQYGGDIKFDACESDITWTYKRVQGTGSTMSGHLHLSVDNEYDLGVGLDYSLMEKNFYAVVCVEKDLGVNRGFDREYFTDRFVVGESESEIFDRVLKLIEQGEMYAQSSKHTDVEDEDNVEVR